MTRRDELEMALIDSVRTADAAGWPSAPTMALRYVAALEEARPALLRAREVAAEWRAACDMEDRGPMSRRAVELEDDLDAAVAAAERAEVEAFERALRDIQTLAKPDNEEAQRRHLAIED